MSSAPAPCLDIAIDDATLRRLIGYDMKRAFNVVQSDLVRTLKPFDLRMLTYTALVLIVDNPGLNQSRLAGAMDIERPNLVALVNALEQRGFIRRGSMPGDRRVQTLNATEEGVCLCRKATDAVAAHEARLFAGLNTEARHAFVALLRHIQRENDA